MARSKARRPGGPTKPAAAPEAVPSRPTGPGAAAPTRAATGDPESPPAAPGNAQGALPSGPSAAAETPAPGPARSSAPSPAAGPRPPAAASPPPAGGGGAPPTGAAGGRPPGDEPPPRRAAASGVSVGASGGAPPGGGSPPRPPGTDGGRARGTGAFLWALGGGVIGGILAALATIYLLPHGGDLDVVRNQVADHAATVERMGARLEALEGTDADARERIAALETAAGALPEPDRIAAQIADVDARLAALEDKVGTLGAGDGGERLAALRDELSSLSRRVSGLQRGGAGGAATEEITALERRLDQVAGGADRVAALSGKLDALSDQVASGQQRTEGAATEVAAVSGQVKLLDERVEALAGEISDLQNRVRTAEERVTAAGDIGGRAATLALLAGQLETAVEQAEGYETPLQSLRALGADDPVVSEAAAQLAPTAAAGVPTLAELRRSFEATANEIVQSEQAPAGDGLLDRAAGNLMRLVTVRPVGADAEGDDAAARVARAEAKLADGDLAGAVAELEGLEGAAAAAAAPWLEQAQKHLAAETALERLRAHTTDLLAQSR
jgi:hypothetical protein